MTEGCILTLVISSPGYRGLFRESIQEVFCYSEGSVCTDKKYATFLQNALEYMGTFLCIGPSQYIVRITWQSKYIVCGQIHPYTVIRFHSSFSLHLICGC